MKKQGWYELGQKWQQENLLEAWEQEKQDLEPIMGRMVGCMDVIIHAIVAQQQQLIEWFSRIDALEQRLAAIEADQAKQSVD